MQVCPAWVLGTTSIAATRRLASALSERAESRRHACPEDSSSESPPAETSLKIAFIGQKGIPAHFGGIEFHVDELSTRLAERGHQVSVYVRSWYVPREMGEYRGVRLLHTPTVQTKHLDAFLHSLASSLHALTQDYDIVHYHALGPSFFAWLPNLRAARIVVTVHALDWQRPKWGRLAKAFLKMTERTAVYLPHCTIAVSRALQENLERKYGREIHYIPNGVHVPPLSPPDLITRNYGLEGDDYLLFLGRLVPEKRVDWLIRAFLQASIPGASGSRPLRLVIAGDDESPHDHSRHLQELANADSRLLFTGNVGGQLKEELLSNARLFVTASCVEGLPIALLEAMAHQRCCLATDIPPHREIIDPGREGVMFPCNKFDQLVAMMEKLVAQDENYRQTMGREARRKVCRKYDWESVVDATEELYRSLAAHRSHARSRPIGARR